MQIIIVTNYFPPEIGAASNRINNLSNSLSDYYDYVNIIAPLPNYPTGKIFNNYSQKFIQRKKMIRLIFIDIGFIHPIAKIL